MIKLHMKDKIFKVFFYLLRHCSFLLLLAAYCLCLGKSLWRDISNLWLLGFCLTNSEWDPRSATEEYGALSFIMGTLYTAFLALVLCVPFSFSVALFNGEYFKGKKIAGVVRSVVDLLAGIPSIVYGLWGFYTVRPILIDLGVSVQGFGIILSAFGLGHHDYPMPLPLSGEFLSMISNNLKEAAYSLEQPD